MIHLTLEEVAAATGGRTTERVNGAGDVAVDEVTTDSRAVPAASLFVALRGERHDGHDHVGEALSSGAVAYLAERPVEVDAPGVVVGDTWDAVRDLARHVRDRVDPTVAAITGSVGKTTTKDLVAAACAAGRRTVAAPGSFNNELGVPLTCLAARSDTEVLVVEVGARGEGHIADLMPLVRPDIAVVTAVVDAHLEMFHDLETIARAKGELVEAVPARGCAVLNAGYDLVLGMAARTEAEVLTYGRGGQVTVRGVRRPVDVVAEDVELDRLARPRFVARTPWGAEQVTLPLAGEHHVDNALAALAVAGWTGIDLTPAAAALADAPVSSWRSEVAEVDGITVLNDAYNANPASMRAALLTLDHIRRDRSARTWAVLGVMAELGGDSDAHHADIGRYAAELGIDRIIVVGEDSAAIAEGAAAAGATAIEHLADADAAAESLTRSVRPGDVVLVKGSRVAGLEHVVDALREARA